MRIFKTKAFAKFQRQEIIADEKLVDAVRKAEIGLVDADLGGGLIKQRIAREGKGKSGGYRTLVAYRKGERSIFLFGFAKSERANIDRVELDALKRLGQGFLELTDDQLAQTIALERISEVNYGPER
jgi:hypothetical protein